MAFKISYCDVTGLTLYGLVFVEDENIGYNVFSDVFSAFTDTLTSEYSITLSENVNRAGFYESTDLSTFPGFVSDARKIHIQVWEQVGGSPDINNDILKGTRTVVLSHTFTIDGFVPPRLEEGTYVGTYGHNEAVKVETRFFSEYGRQANLPSGINFQVFNPSGNVIATGFYSASGVSFDNRSYGATIPITTSYSAGSYRIRNSALYLEHEYSSNHYFSVATGINVVATATFDVSQLGYATGAVNDASATTTSFVTSLASTTNDFYNGQILVFTEGALRGQGRIVSDYVGASKTITLNKPLASAPVNGTKIAINPLGGEYGL